MLWPGHLDGQYIYRSFYDGLINVVADKVVGSPSLAQPWTPEGTLNVKTSTLSDWEVTGTLTFGPGVSLKVTGKTIPAKGQEPSSVELMGEGLGAVYQIKGWFVPDEDHLVGSVLCLANDLRKQPVGTVRPFVLFPKT